MTVGNRITVPPKVLKVLCLKQGEEVAYFKDEYGRVIIQKVTAPSILSTMELPDARPITQKVFP